MTSDYQNIDKCVAGPGVNIELGVDCIYEGCSCPGYCEYEKKPANCSCKCAYDEHGCVYRSYLEACSPPIVECNSRCTCGSQCRNRLSQKECSQHQCLTVFTTKRKGLGVKSSVDLRPGSYLCEYVGEIISTKEANARLKMTGNNGSCYILQYREHIKSRIMTTNIDATRVGNVARFFNHSCHPNLSVIPVRSDSVLPRLCIFTCKEVRADEELCFSYFGRMDITADHVSIGTKPCVCGSSNCIQYLPFT